MAVDPIELAPVCACCGTPSDGVTSDRQAPDPTLPLCAACHPAYAAAQVMIPDGLLEERLAAVVVLRLLNDLPHSQRAMFPRLLKLLRCDRDQVRRLLRRAVTGEIDFAQLLARL